MATHSKERRVSTQPSRSDFWKYWSGQTISNLGSSVTLFVLPLLVYKLTGSALNLGLATAATFLPYLLFGLLLGALTDRINRKRMMIAVDIGRAFIVASIPLMAALNSLSAWWIYGVSFLHATLTICFEAGQFAAIPSLVNRDDLVTANGHIQASYSAASIAGPVLAGILLFITPLPTLMLVDALSFLVSAGSLALITASFNTDTGEQKSLTTIGRDAVEGLRYVLNHPVLRNISFMMALVNLVSTTVYAQIVLFAQYQFHANSAQTSLFYSAASVGVVVMSLAAGLLRKRWSFSVVALGALMVSGLLKVLLAFTPWYWVAILLYALSTGLGTLFNINTASLRQAIVPNHMLGRVVSIASVLAWSAIPVGSLLGGFAIEQTHNVTLVFAFIGVLSFLLPLAFSFTALGHSEQYLAKKERESDTSKRGHHTEDVSFVQ